MYRENKHKSKIISFINYLEIVINKQFLVNCVEKNEYCLRIHKEHHIPLMITWGQVSSQECTDLITYKLGMGRLKAGPSLCGEENCLKGRRKQMEAHYSDNQSQSTRCGLLSMSPSDHMTLTNLIDGNSFHGESLVRTQREE